MNALRTAAEWMWDRRGQNIWWKPPVLTEANPDSTAPKLSPAEAESIFRLLEDEKLIFPFRHSIDGETAYLINEVKEKEWALFLKGLNPFQRFFVRPLVKIFKNFWTVIVWLISVLIAGAIGGFFSAWWKSFLAGG